MITSFNTVATKKKEEKLIIMFFNDDNEFVNWNLIWQFLFDFFDTAETKNDSNDKKCLQLT